MKSVKRFIVFLFVFIVFSYSTVTVKCSPVLNTMNLNPNTMKDFDNDSIEMPVRRQATPEDNSLKKMYNHFFSVPKQTLLHLVHNVLNLLKKDTEKEVMEAKEKARQRTRDLFSLFPDLLQKDNRIN